MRTHETRTATPDDSPEAGISCNDVDDTGTVNYIYGAICVVKGDYGALSCGAATLAHHGADGQGALFHNYAADPVDNE